MADIDVERKGSPTWIWWILGLLVLGLILWALMGMGDDDEDVGVVEPAPVVTPMAGDAGADMAAMPTEIQTFRAECTEMGGTPTDDMGLEHEFTVTCLQNLHQALAAITVRDTVGGVDVQQQLDDYHSTVTQLQESEPTATTHAATTREAAMGATRVMEGMRDAYFQASGEVQTAVQEAVGAAEGLNAQGQLLEQRDAVRGFFRESADALESMWRGFGTATI